MLPGLNGLISCSPPPAEFIGGAQSLRTPYHQEEAAHLLRTRESRSPSHQVTLVSLNHRSIICGRGSRLTILGYLDGIHIVGPAKDVAAAFELLKAKLGAVDLVLSGPNGPPKRPTQTAHRQEQRVGS